MLVSNTKIKALENQIKQLKKAIVAEKIKLQPEFLFNEYNTNDNVNDHDHNPKLKLSITKQFPKSHFGKIYDIDWDATSERLVSVSAGPFLLLWNASTGNKLCAWGMDSSWNMCCCHAGNYSYSDNHTLNSIDHDHNNHNTNTGTKMDENIKISVPLVAYGGLNNSCTVHYDNRINYSHGNKSKVTLSKHQGYISKCRFMPFNTNRILTASGDSSLILWDIEKETDILAYKKHNSDVLCFDINPIESNIIVSGDVNGQTNMWDIRDRQYFSTSSSPNCDRNSLINGNVNKNTMNDSSINIVKNITNAEMESKSNDVSDAKSDTSKYDPNTYRYSVDDNELMGRLCLDPNANLSNMNSDSQSTVESKNEENTDGMENNDSYTPKDDINSIKWFPDGKSYFIATEKGICMMYDIDSARVIQQYDISQARFRSNVSDSLLQEMGNSAVTSVDVSQSGRYLFVGYDKKPGFMVWDVIKNMIVQMVKHPNRVSVVKVAPNGRSIVTGCWDYGMRLIA